MSVSMKTVTSIFLAIALILTACSSPTQSGKTQDTNQQKESASKNEQPSPTNAKPSEPQVIEVMQPPAENEGDKAFNVEMVKLFEKLNPGYKVKLVEADTKVENGKITTMLNSGVDVPSIIQTGSGPSRMDVLSSSLMPLNDLYKENGWADKLTPTAYNFLVNFDNNLPGDLIFDVPNNIDAIQVYYNKDIFQNLGLNVPKTSAEFMNVMEKLKAAGITPLVGGTRSGFAAGWLYGNLMEAIAGNKAVTKLMSGEAKWTDPEFIKVAETLRDWVDKGYIDKKDATQTTDDAKARFLAKQAGMTVIGSWFIKDIKDKNMEDSVGMFVMPSFVDGETAYPTGGMGGAWVIPAKVKDVSLGVKWIDFLLSEEYAQLYNSDPRNTEILASKAALKHPPVNDLLEEAMNSISEGSGFNPSVFIGVHAKEVFFQNLQGVIGGIATPQEAMGNIEKGAEKDRSK